MESQILIDKNKFSNYFTNLSNLSSNQNFLTYTWIDTKLGPMLAIADEKSLYLLEFMNRKGLQQEIERLKINWQIVQGKTKPLISIELELKKYFNCQLKEFKTPIVLSGTPFQKKVWQELIKIPIGKTISYLNLAVAINNPKGFRAAANANGKNQLAIIVPCHRVINANGDLGGYGGGINNKQWLLNHEKQIGNNGKNSVFVMV